MTDPGPVTNESKPVRRLSEIDPISPAIRVRTRSVVLLGGRMFSAECEIATAYASIIRGRFHCRLCSP